MYSSPHSPATHAGPLLDQTTRVYAGLRGPTSLEGVSAEELQMDYSVKRVPVLRMHLLLMSVEIHLHGWRGRPARDLHRCVAGAEMRRVLHHEREAAHSRWRNGG